MGLGWVGLGWRGGGGGGVCVCVGGGGGDYTRRCSEHAAVVAAEAPGGGGRRRCGGGRYYVHAPLKRRCDVENASVGRVNALQEEGGRGQRGDLGVHGGVEGEEQLRAALGMIGGQQAQRYADGDVDGQRDGGVGLGMRDEQPLAVEAGGGTGRGGGAARARD